MTNMKKLLLTSALISGFSAAALADAPTITAGGKIDWKTAFTHQKQSFQTAIDRHSRKQHMETQNNVNIKAEGQTDFGMKYGAVVELGHDTRSTANSGKDVFFKDTFLFMESNMGRLELGSHAGASDTMKVDASNIARATGGVDGAFEDHVNSTVGYLDTGLGKRIAAQYITAPNLPLTQSSQYARYNKVSYYTPEFSGLQLGVSYAIDTGDNGNYRGLTSKFLELNDDNDGVTPGSANNFSNAFEVGLKYKYQFDQVGLELGATGQFASAQKVAPTVTVTTAKQLRSVKAYNVGGTLTYTNFSLSGSYGSWGKSTNTKQTEQYNHSSSRYYTLGGAYVQGPVGLSVTYLDSKRLMNKFHNISVGADYQLAPGMLPYVEGNFFKYKPHAGAFLASTGGTAGDAKKNNGNVTFVGVKFMF
ncbi:MAG: porin [Sphingobacteriia bacterium]|nr:porin [Sphingobacteriia bacterium]